MSQAIADHDDSVDAPVIGSVGRLVPMIIGSALLMQTLDATVIANALPSMAVALHEKPVTLNLAITSYLFASTVFLPISGWVANRFGARQVFRLAIFLFTISSLLCGLSRNLPELIGARLLQGMAGAMMTPVGRLVLLKTASKADLVRAMTYVTLPAMIGPVLGPPIGGFIVTYLSWPWVFFINIPVGVLGVVLVSLFINDVECDAHRPFDWWGFFLTGAGLAGLTFGLENIGRGAAPPGVIAAMFAGGALCLALYVVHARRARHPLLDLSVLRTPTFLACVAGGSFLRFTLGATPFLLAMLLQVGFGLDALTAGLMTFASAAGALLMKTTMGPILRWLGFKVVLIGDSIITAMIFMSYALFNAHMPHGLIFGSLLIGGFFRSLQFTALNTLAFADIPPSGMSNASTMISMSMPLSQTIGIGVSVVVLHVFQGLHGSATLRPADVTPAFVVIGLLSLLGLFYFVRLPRDAGAAVSGARVRAHAA